MRIFTAVVIALVPFGFALVVIFGIILMTVKGQDGVWLVTQNNKSWEVTNPWPSRNCTHYKYLDGNPGKVCGDYSLAMVKP